MADPPVTRALQCGPVLVRRGPSQNLMSSAGNVGVLPNRYACDSLEGELSGTWRTDTQPAETACTRRREATRKAHKPRAKSHSMRLELEQLALSQGVVHPEIIGVTTPLGFECSADRHSHVPRIHQGQRVPATAEEGYQR